MSTLVSDYLPLRTTHANSDQKDSHWKMIQCQHLEHNLHIAGDKEKELWPHSDYRSKFLGEQLGSRDVMPAADKHSGPATIRGDARSHHLGQFTTTTKSEFVGRHLQRHHLMDPALRVWQNTITWWHACKECKKPLKNLVKNCEKLTPKLVQIALNQHLLRSDLQVLIWNKHRSASMFFCLIL